MLFRDLVGKFLSWCQRNRAPRTAEFYELQLTKAVRRFGDLPAADLRPYHVHELKVTWHLALALQRLYRWATEEMEYLERNPLKALKRPRLGARRRILTPAELLRLLRAAAQDLRRYLFALRETAARPQEITSVDWADLRWLGAKLELPRALLAGEAFFYLTQYKSRDRASDTTTPRVIPISPRLGRLLWRLLRAGMPEGKIFRTAAGQEWNRNSLRCRFRSLIKRAGLELSRRGESIVCYTLRHTAATALAAQGFQMSNLQALLGHKNLKTTGRYVHVHLEHLRAAWRAHFDRRRRRDL